MIIGIVGLVVGNILVWQSNVETTQFFTGYIIGIFCLVGAVALPRIPRVVLAAAAGFFIITNEQKVTPTSSAGDLGCVHGTQRFIDGGFKCVCTPPYMGDLCDQCPVGAINVGTVDQPECYTCRHQYMFPFCRELLPGYDTETSCSANFTASCTHPTPGFLSLNPKTYDNAPAGSVRDELYDLDETNCLNNFGTVYCDKCIEGHAGPNCCADGFYGQNCGTVVPKCAAALDYGAKLKENKLPTGFGTSDPEICYTLGDDQCSCGGEFIGDSMCTSHFCVDGSCSTLARVPEFEFRCDCQYGVGPSCVMNTCYGGTRMWAVDKGICQCNAQHLDSFNGREFDACEIEITGQCYPGLFGEKCEECQCVADITQWDDTKQCEKNMYGVFDRDFRTKEYTGNCMDSGVCTNTPDDCGVVEEGTDRCGLFTNMDTFTAILFSGDLCLDSRDSKCQIWAPCQPR